MYSCELEPVVREYTIPSAHLGIEWTVDHMQELATQAACAPVVQEAAREIVGSSAGRDAADRIRRYLEANVRFQFDPPGVELIRTPELLLRQIHCRGESFGDCDDVAVLGAALGLAVGLPATYVLIAFHDTDPFEHVYTELETPAGAVELDTTRPEHLPPELQIRRTERREVVMYGGNPCGEGLSGFWGDLWGGVKEVGGTVITETVEQYGRSTDPYGPGTPEYTGTWQPPIILQTGPGAPAPAVAPMPATSPALNALLIGGVALAGLKIANII